MIKFNKTNLVFIMLGIAIAGTYWYFYACDYGCAITSSWWKTMGIGGLFGYLIGDTIDEQLKKPQPE